MNLSREHESEVIAVMLQPDFYDYPVVQCQLIETHISWVILTGNFAYKIKKPVDFGFLDFSTLEKRRFYCEEELRLNRRAVASLYLGVLPITNDITNDAGKLVLDGAGKPVEYVVKMVQFPQQAQLDRLLARGELKLWHIDRLAQMIVSFHQQIAIADNQSSYGTAAEVYHPVVENFMQIRGQNVDQYAMDILTKIEQWSQSSYGVLKDEFSRRKADGAIRECHGDMHLRNLAWVDNKPIAFDCIEFNPQLRWIDVMSEVAFLVMDLQERKQPILAQRFLNTYLQYSGDYAGLSVLAFYLCYRAMVRAKVGVLRLQQAGIKAQEKELIKHEFTAYLQLAQSYTQSETPQLIITRGLSASGKSTVSQQLTEHLAAIRIRSDIERKRMAGLWPEGIQKSPEEIQKLPDEIQKTGFVQNIYTAAFTEQTYHRLLQYAAKIIDAGYTVIVDAAFLKQRQRQLFQQLAAQKEVAFIILELTALPDTLRKRIQARKRDISDADLKVLEQQLVHYQALSNEEIPVAIEINTEKFINLDSLTDKIKSACF
jgi:aminoglycoside phosphotransferase family enzyme/gluconate kinase